ncbi:MAG: hypothetical protein GXY03_05525 [Solirubrobacterales bacterium]|nr:hypothetical protein [Solirubrobacterales bacterium]
MTATSRALAAEAPEDRTGRRARPPATRTRAARCTARLLAAAAAIGATAFTAAAPAAAADDCANADYRVGPSAKLPDCRAYEMVTPADKGGYGLQQLRTTGSTSYLSVGGEQATFGLVTPFADPISGNLGIFVSRRTPGGWTTRNITPEFCDPDPSGLGGYMTPHGFASDFSAALINAPRSNCDPDDHGGIDIYLRPVDGNEFVWLSHNNQPKLTDDGATFVDSSADLGHVVFSTIEKLVLPLEAARTGRGLYDRTGGEAVPVALDDAGNLFNDCGITAVSGDANTPGRVSRDGRVILFKPNSGAAPGCSQATDDARQLFARIDHERTVALSPSLLAVPEARQEPVFMGGTGDGSRIFFTTTERLTEDATPGGGLYVYDLSDVLSGASDEGELRFLTPSVNASPAAIGGRNLISFAEDGSRAYFLATGVLEAGAPVGLNPPKLYTVDVDSGEVRYIGPWNAGTTQDTTTGGTASPDGSKLAYVEVVGGVHQVQLYDADDDSLTCVSCPASGDPQVGEARIHGRTTGSADRPGRMGLRRNVTNDGRVFFNALDQLVSADSNSLFDVYEYDDGEHKLLSSGTGPYDQLLWGVGPDGREVMFTSHESLVAADFDNGDQDLYVARVGGGFPTPPPAAVPCSGDGCQGGSPSGPSGGGPVSAEFRGAGNATVPRVARVSLVRGRVSVRGRAGALRLRVSEAGRVAVRGRGIVNVSRRVGKAGQVRVRVRLSKAGRRALAKRGRLAVRVTVRLRTADGQRRQARGRIVFRAPNAGKAGGR